MSAPRIVAFARPTAADIVICRFPLDLRKPRPGPKERPGIILQVLEAAQPDGPFRVTVCYATSNRGRLFPHEFEITHAAHPEEFERAGLAADSKFDMKQVLTLPYTDEWFALRLHIKFGHSPKIGELHPLSVPRLQAAWAAVKR